MPIQFQCAACQANLRVSDESAGKQAKCKCGAVVKIPMVSSAVSPPSSPAMPKQASTAKGQAAPASVKQTKSPSPQRPSSNMGSLFDELTEKDRQAKPAVVPKADRGGKSDGAFLKAYAASSKSIDQSSGGNVEGAPRNSLQLRKEHLAHESSIKAWGGLNVFGGVMYILSAMFGLVAGIMALSSGEPSGQTAGVFQLVIAGISAVFGGFFVAFGKALQNLKPWGRIVGIVFLCFGLLGIPLGTLLSAYLLYVFISQKGVYCFSAEYKKVVASTPEIKLKTPFWVWILLILFVLAVLAAVVIGILAAVNAGT